MKIQMSNNSDVKRLISEHAAQARQLLKKQQMRIQKRRREWEAEDSLPTQLQSKEAKSDAFLTFQSRDSFNPRELQFSTESVNQEQSTSKESHDAEMDFQAQISFTETQQAQMKARLDAMVDDLSKLSKLHETSLEQLTRRNSIEYKSKENEILSKIAEREFYQSVERSDLLRQHEK